MLLFDRRFLLVLPLWLTACGFTPVYAPGETGAAMRGQVLVQEPVDREGYLLVQELETRLGRGGSQYGLNFILFLEDEQLAVSPSGDITRYNLVAVVDYVLSDLNSEQVIAKGRVNNFTGYSATGSTVDTLAAEQDAIARLMGILADQIVGELYAKADLAGS